MHSTQSIEAPDWSTLVGPKRGGEIRLTGENGDSTDWIERSNLVLAGSTVCLRSDERPWKRITKVRISRLETANVPALLADLPRRVVVVHPLDGSGEIELHTYGADLSKWVRSRAHDPTDVGVPRYRIQTWGTWRGPVTWQQLPATSVPKFGWRTAQLAGVEVRKVNIAGTIAVSVVVAPLIVVAVGLAVLVRIPVPTGEPPPSHPTSRERAADLPLAAVAAGIALSNADEGGGGLRSTLCDDVPTN